MLHLKKWISGLLAMALAVVFSLTAFAADNPYTITIQNDATGHTYEAYQVFSGALSGTTLSDIQWGTGVNGTTLLAALQADAALGTTFAGCSTAADVADKLTESNAAAFAQIVGQNLVVPAGGAAASIYSTADKNYTISGLAAGYYLVKDKDGTQKDASDAYTSFILKVVGNTDAAPQIRHADR